MTTITGTILGLDNTSPVAGVYVTVKLVPSTTSNPPGFVATSPSNVVGDAVYTTKRDGTFSVELTDNATITPAGTCYRFNYRIPGVGNRGFYKYVGADDSDVDDLQDADPTNVPEGQGHGDVGRTWDKDNRLVAIQGIELSSTPPDEGDFLGFDGTQVAWLPGPTGGSGLKTRIHASEFGFGASTDAGDLRAALLDTLAAQRAVFTQADLAAGAIGVPITFPAGHWLLEPPDLTGAYGPVIPVVAPTDSGAIKFLGEASGAFSLQATGELGHQVTLTSATRGANGVGAPFTGNAITLGFDEAHLSRIGQKIKVWVTSRGRAMLNTYVVIDVPDATHVTYMAGDVDDGTGHTRTSGGDLDRLIPPLTYKPGPWQNETENVVSFCETFLDPRNFRQPHLFIPEGLTIAAADHVSGPLAGIGVGICSRMSALGDFAVSGFHIGGMYSGTPDKHPIWAALGGDGPQNTDHNWVSSKNFNGNEFGIAFVDNCSTSYFRKLGELGPGLGGGRDNHLTADNVGQTGVDAILCNDAGNFETLEINGTNLKGGSYPILFEGVDGVDPNAVTGIDAIVGWMKIESPGNYSFALDETGRRSFEKPLDLVLRMEAGIDFNGADIGIPGGIGSVAQGSFQDDTDKPWEASDVSLVTVTDPPGVELPDGVHDCPMLTATVPDAMFGVDGGRDLGTVAVLGLAFRTSTSPYASDGVVTAGIAGAGTWSSASINAHGGLTTDDIGLRIDSTHLAGGSDTILDVVNPGTNTSHAVMTHATTAGSGLAWTVKNDGTVAQAGVCWASRVATKTDPDIDGLVTITMPYPIWAGPDLEGPYQAQIGEAAHIRCGYLNGHWDVRCQFDTQSLDRMCHAQQFFDVIDIPSPGGITLLQDNLGSSTRRVLPSWRVLNTIGRQGAGGVIAGTSFSAPGLKASPLDVGKTLYSDGLNGGNSNDVIAAVVSPTEVTMTNVGIDGTGLAWQLTPRGVLPPRFVVRRGANEFHLYAHDVSDVNDVEQKHLVEFSAGGAVQRSKASKAAQFAGVAMGGSPAGCFPTVRVTGTIGSNAARVWFDGPMLTVARDPSILVRADDSNGAMTDGLGSIVAGQPLVDAGDGTVALPPTSGEYRRVGQSTDGEVQGEIGIVVGDGGWEFATVDGGVEA